MLRGKLLIKFPLCGGERTTIMELWHDGEKVGEILTDRTLSLDDCIEILGIDLTEQVGGDPVWDYDLFKMIY